MRAFVGYKKLPTECCRGFFSGAEVFWVSSLKFCFFSEIGIIFLNFSLESNNYGRF